jgi:hypothetical protein
VSSDQVEDISMSLQCFSECFFQEGLLFLKGKKNSFGLRKGVAH